MAWVVLLDARMAKLNSFRELLVWQKSLDLAVRCHRVARRFPRDEQPALGSQTRKSALSMPSNIAEGFARHSTASYIQWGRHIARTFPVISGPSSLDVITGPYP